MKQATQHPQPGHRGRSTLVIGLVLLVLGSVLLAVNLGYRIPYFVWEYWPLVLIFAGLVGILAPSRHLSRSGGIWLLAAGLYVEISIHGFLDLGWGSAWPIFVIAAGLDMIFDRRRHAGRSGGDDPSDS